MSKKRYPRRPSDGHAHHWLIPGPPARPIGTCRLCGTQKRFSNTTPLDGQYPVGRVATVPLNPPGEKTMP